MKQRDFHRKVRVVYRAMRKLYGKEKVQDECLRVFKVVCPFYYKAKNGEDIRFDGKAMERMNKIFLSWNAEDGSEFARLLALVTDGMTTMMTRDEFVQFCDDILPVVMRIRKLTERECFRLQGVNDKDIDTILGSGISRSACYKLAGNSISAGGNFCNADGDYDGPLYNLFRKMFVETGPDIVKGAAIQLSLF